MLSVATAVDLLAVTVPFINLHKSYMAPGGNDRNATSKNKSTPFSAISPCALQGSLFGQFCLQYWRLDADFRYWLAAG